MSASLPLWLGTMQFGATASEPEARAMIEHFLEAGGRLFDTADNYAGGDSERIVGRALADAGPDVTIATKIGNPDPAIAGSGGHGPDWMRQAMSRSLDRLGRDRLDVLYLHQEDNTVPLETTVSALAGLYEKGLFGAWGISNFRPWKIAELVRLADAHAMQRPSYAQPYYHMLNRTPEADYLPACAHFGMHVATYSPLARGILTGKYADGARPEGSRAMRGDTRILEMEFLPQTLAAAEKAADHARSRGRSLSGLALRWVLTNRLVSSVIAGPRTPEQLRAYLDALATPYDAEDEAVLSALALPGQTATPGHSDPRYRLHGRETPFDGDKGDG